MVLKRGLLVAIFLALIVMFAKIDNANINTSTNTSRVSQISFSGAVVYSIGKEYVKITAGKIDKYNNFSELKDLSIEFLSADNQTYTLSANQAKQVDSIIELSGNVICTMADSGVIKAKKIFYDQAKRLVYNKSEFSVDYTSHKLVGNSFSLDYVNNTFEALDTHFVLKIPKQNKKI